MTMFDRADWGARPAKAGPGSLDPERVEGIALHWPAMTRPLNTVESVKAALRGWQEYHQDIKGWSDIGYQVAVDQLGNVYSLRGLRTQSGANGDVDVNERFGACLLVLAPGEQPSQAMIDATRDVIRQHRALFSRSRRIVGHGQIRPEPTACPGPIAQGLIDRGVFEPVAPGPTPGEELRKDVTANVKKAKEQGRPRVADLLRRARDLIPKRQR